MWRDAEREELRRDQHVIEDDGDTCASCGGVLGLGAYYDLCAELGEVCESEGENDE